ncbi:MAG TPA: bifunctional phosphoglucose/phosphomannose isomerase [Actinomycetota bacterium]|nr:bifunctional phosphoglucose/phosphomannose isomerase [Actinomycetota bacterium]
MISLDDEQALRAADPSGLLDAFLSIPDQLADAYGTAAARRDLAPDAAVEGVVLCGMGGSAAAADVVAALIRPAATVPVVVVRGTTLPAWAAGRTLVVCVSYSGNTDETLTCYAEARRRGCPTIAVATGGSLRAAAERASALFVTLPGTASMPRAGLGELTGALLGVIGATGIDRPGEGHLGEAVETLRRTAAELAPGAASERNEAKDVASWVGDRIPVAWGSEGLTEPLAVRWKAAFNENAKVPAMASVLPELGHHEVVGWTAAWGRRFALVVLRASDEQPSLSRRLEATLDVVSDAGLEHREVRGRGASRLAQVLSVALIGDVASAYHALMRGIDPTPIEAIDRIKDRLR